MGRGLCLIVKGEDGLFYCVADILSGRNGRFHLTGVGPLGSEHTCKCLSFGRVYFLADFDISWERFRRNLGRGSCVEMCVGVVAKFQGQLPLRRVQTVFALSEWRFRCQTAFDWKAS